jgi:sugar O-acyltransferase (sialic acid O-acetyltransferase NeuD family)
MPAKRRVVVVGAGGQARDTAWLIRELERADQPYELVGFVVSDMKLLSVRDSKELVLGDLGWLEGHAAEVDALALGIGNPTARLKVARQLAAEFPRLEFPILAHPSALFDRDSAKLGRGCMLAARCVGSVNLQIGEFALINIGVTLGHEAVVGAGSVIHPAASISGGVVIGEGCLVGTGARLLQYLRVGAGTTVGAGAVVTRDVGPGQTVVGVPARRMERREVVT